MFVEKNKNIIELFDGMKLSDKKKIQAQHGVLAQLIYIYFKVVNFFHILK
jgi:hypothetical protein